MSNYDAFISGKFDNQHQRTYNAKEVGDIFGYILQSMGYAFQPMNLDNGIAQAIGQPLAAPKRMTMTVKDVAHELHISKQTVYKLVHNGELPAFKVGRNYVISTTAFKAWVEQRGDAQEGERREAC